MVEHSDQLDSLPVGGGSGGGGDNDDHDDGVAGVGGSNIGITDAGWLVEWYGSDRAL